MSQGFIKYNRGEQSENLESRPLENHLLSVIARRVSRTGNPVKEVEIGEALIGDYDKIGLKRQKYRTALSNLIKWGYVTTRVTNRKTYARLCNSDVYDCNILDANQQPNPKITREQPDANHNQEEKKKELKKKEEEKEREKALTKIEFLENELKKSQLALKTEKEKEKEKSSEKKESEPFLDAEEKEQITNDFLANKKSGHQFPDITAQKTYQVDTPKSATNPKKPYEVFLSSYPFEKKGWSEKLKQIFLTYCEVKNEKSHKGYATAQIKMRLTEINEAIEKHEIDWIEKLVTSAANGAWGAFEFDDRIKDRKEKENQKANGKKNSLFMPSVSLTDRNTWNK